MPPPHMRCTVRLVSGDFNIESWNKSKEFDIYLGEEKNKAKALKKERFNRFVYMSAVVLYHQDQVREFLAQFDTITNTLACIVRAFEECEFPPNCYCHSWHSSCWTKTIPVCDLLWHTKLWEPHCHYAYCVSFMRTSELQHHRPSEYFQSCIQVC